MTTEKVLCNAGLEAVGLQRVAALQQAEFRVCDEQMEEPGLGAYRAIATRRFNICGCIDLEADSTAMAATLVRGHRCCRSQTTRLLFAGIA